VALGRDLELVVDGEWVLERVDRDVEVPGVGGLPDGIDILATLDNGRWSSPPPPVSSSPPALATAAMPISSTSPPRIHHRFLAYQGRIALVRARSAAAAARACRRSAGGMG
jgi:hypothetical protein